jgi:hypothetical protein
MFKMFNRAALRSNPPQRGKEGVSPPQPSQDFPRSAPEWLRKKVTDELLGIRYVPGSANAPQTDPKKGFDCWGWDWFYFFLWGVTLPKEGMRARRLFEKIRLYERGIFMGLRFLDIPIFKETEPPFRSHTGVMEDEFRMLHCGENSGGVARAYIHRLPAPTSVLRLKDVKEFGGA